jgi:hypothetical protein
MMLSIQLLSLRKVAFSATLLCLALSSQTARAQSNPRAGSPGASVGSANSPAVESPPTQSIFVMPTAPREGKDPFFPRSTRPYTTRVIVTNQTAMPVIADLRLDGISGTPEHRLAIINYKTFDTGEDGDVNTNAGRMRIRCIEIGADSAIIQIGGERRVLHLRAGSSLASRP